jgi:hypothetical protein
MQSRHSGRLLFFKILPSRNKRIGGIGLRFFRLRTLVPHVFQLQFMRKISAIDENRLEIPYRSSKNSPPLEWIGACARQWTPTIPLFGTFHGFKYARFRVRAQVLSIGLQEQRWAGANTMIDLVYVGSDGTLLDGSSSTSVRQSISR